MRVTVAFASLLFALAACGTEGGDSGATSPEGSEASSGGDTAREPEPDRGPRLERAEEEAIVTEHRGDALRFRVPIEGRPRRGPHDAAVTIVMFSDLECPYCRAAMAIVERILRDYDDVRLVWANLPLPMHPDAEPAARVLAHVHAAAGTEAFWALHHAIHEAGPPLDRSRLRGLATEVEVDPALVDAALEGGLGVEQVRADMALADQLSLRGTPTFFFNGMRVDGALPYDDMADIIEEESERVAAMREAGLPGAWTYDALTERGYRRVPERPDPDPDAVYAIAVDDSAPQLGPDDALVTLVVASDFQCPFCARMATRLNAMHERFGDDVRIVFWHHPLEMHDLAWPAASAAEEVFRQRGSAAFFRYHDAVFEAQASLDEATLVALAEEVGADPGEVRRAMIEARHEEDIEARVTWLERFGANATPALFVNGRFVRGLPSEEALVALITEERTRAQEKIDNGVPPSRVYEVTIEGGATSIVYLPIAPPNVD